MKRRLLVASFLVGWFIASAFGPPPPPPSARASSFYLTISEAYLDYTSCTFPVKAMTTGTGVVHLLTDYRGMVKQLILVQPTTRSSFINMNNGKTLTTPSVNMLKANYDSSGSMTYLAMRGLVRRIVVPGEGLVAIELGQVIINFKYNNQGQIISSDVVDTGLRSGVTIPKLCPYLE